jgi:hypothetical protein
LALWLRLRGSGQNKKEGKGFSSKPTRLGGFCSSPLWLWLLSLREKSQSQSRSHRPSHIKKVIYDLLFIFFNIFIIYIKILNQIWGAGGGVGGYGFGSSDRGALAPPTPEPEPGNLKNCN